MAEAQTKPCEYCGTPVTKTATQQSQRKYWTCSRVCANKRRIQLGNTPGWAPNRFRGQRETRPCAACSQPVTRYLSESNHEKPWTCSQQCMGRQKYERLQADGTWTSGKKPRRGDTIPCSVCEKPFYRQPAYIAQGRHLCSRECNRVWQTKTPVVKQCARCGSEMTLKPSQAQISHCSRACQVAAKIQWPMPPDEQGRQRRKNKAGYVLVWVPTHPNTSQKGWQLEHRLVMEKALGRYLTSDEPIDHINEIKDDNRLENLQVMTVSAHSVKTNRDKERAKAKLLAELAAFRAKYGPLESE